MLRYYTVFNAVEQCEGLEDKVPAEPEPREFRPVEEAAQILQNMPGPPEIVYGGDQACYRPSQDRVHVPPPERFDPREEFFCTLWHELTHATGHKSRLARPGVMDVQAFGTTEYSKEELVAEIGAAFLCHHCGIDNATLENSAAYLNGWLAKLRRNRRLIITASAQAQKAADYILGNAPTVHREGAIAGGGAR